MEAGACRGAASANGRRWLPTQKRQRKAVADEAKIFLAGSAARGAFGERSIFHDAFELD